MVNINNSVNTDNKFIGKTQNHKHQGGKVIDDVSPPSNVFIKGEQDALDVAHKTAVAEKQLYTSIKDNISFHTRERYIKEDKYNEEVVEEEKTESAVNKLFDFDKVAENVLAFISKSILAAKGRGEGEESLNNMFEQARKGVEMGIGNAVEELEGIGGLNENIKEGIDKSRSLINTGIDDLHNRVFNLGNDNTLLTEVDESLTVDLSEADKASLNEILEKVKYLQQQFITNEVIKSFAYAEKENVGVVDLERYSPERHESNKSLTSQKYKQVASVGHSTMRQGIDERSRMLEPAAGIIRELSKIKSDVSANFSEQATETHKLYQAIFNTDFTGSPSELGDKLAEWQNITSQI